VFVADLFGIATKDDLASMEHPLFALKAGDKAIRRYERNGVHVEIQPGMDGLATIHDKDVWIYCISQLTEAMNRGTIFWFLPIGKRAVEAMSYLRKHFAG